MAVSLLYQRGVLILLLSLFFVQSYGQANITNYVFSSNNDTYSSIIGGTQIVQGTSSPLVDNVTYTNIPIGFDFWYMGRRYTSVTVSTNGWLSLGVATIDSAPNNNLNSGGGRPVVAPLWDDLAVFPGIIGLLIPGNITRSLSDDVGPKTFTVQWTSIKWSTSAANLLGGAISFQAKLTEDGNIQFAYLAGLGSIVSPSASIGITGTEAGVFRSLTNSSSAPALVLNPTGEASSLSTVPSNLNYVFNPTELAAPSSLSFSRVGSTGMRLNWTDNSTGEAGFVIYRSVDGGATYSYLATTPANATFYDDTSLTNGTTYYYRVFTLRENLSIASANGNQTANCTSFAWGTVPNATGAGNTGPVCAGYPLTLTANAVDGATYSWTGPNGFTSALQNPVISSYSDAAKGTYTVTITRNGCTLNANTTVSSMGQGRWTGIVNTSWSTPDNWCNGVLPTAAVNVSIPATGVINEPILTGSGTVNNINVEANRTLVIGSGGNLQIAGAITNTGAIVATAGKVTFNGTAPQTIPQNAFSTNAILNLELNNLAGVTLSGALRLTGTLTATAGVFNANGFLTLASSETLTAQVAPIPTAVASVQGQVKVERFIKGGTKDLYRGYRMLSSPVYDNTTEFRTADVQGNRSAQFTQLIDDVIVTGTGGGANGFDPTHNDPVGAWTHNLGYVGIPTIYTSVNAGKGMYLFFRGNRDNILLKTNSPYVDPENVVMDFDGILNQQDVTVGLNYSATLGGFNLLGNPYAATIDWDSPNWGTDKGSINNSIWLWNPVAKSYATYINGVGTLNGSRYISSGQSFFVRASAPSSIRFKENIKAATQQPPFLLMSVPLKQAEFAPTEAPAKNFPLRSVFRMTMKPTDSFGEDETVIAFSEGSDPEYTIEDALHLNGEVVNIASVVGARKLAINFIPPSARDMEIGLTVNAATTGNYMFSFNLDEYFQGHSLLLKDNLLQQTIAIVAGGIYNFSIDKTKAETFGDNRFSITVEPPTVLPVGLVSFTAKKQNQGVQLNWITSSEIDHKQFKLFRAGDDKKYILLNDFPPKEDGKYAYLDVVPLTGFNYYKLVQVDLNGDEKETDPVSVNFNIEKLNSITVFPNPVKDKFIIRVNGLKEDRFELNLYDIAGRTLKSCDVSKIELINGYGVDVLGLSQGVFFVKIKEVGTRKIIGVHKVVKR